MKAFRIFIVVFALMAMMPSSLFAQNQKKVRCNDEQCVFEILAKLNSRDKVTVAKAEQTLDSLANDVRYTGDSESKDALKNAILPFVMKFDNCESNEFLFSLLPVFCNNDDAYEIFKLIENEKLADLAIRTIGEISGSDGMIEKYVIKNHDDLKYKPALAYAIGKLNMGNMENELISWLDNADNATKIEVYNALLIIGSSGKTMKIVEKGAKKFYKSKDSNEKIAGMRLMVAVKGEKALPQLYKALKNEKKTVRVEALNLMKPFVNQGVVKNVVKKCKKGEALIDAINWLGDIKDDTQMEFLLKQLASDNKEVVKATIRAIFKIDNADGINAVKPLFGGEYQEVIKESMIAYEGNYRAVMNDVFRGNDVQKLAALQIVESRPDVGLQNRVRELLNNENQQIRNDAFNVLKYIVAPSSSEFLSVLLETCDAKYVEQVQLAIKNAMKNAPDEVKDRFASTLKHVKPEIMPRFYNVFAYFGTELCVDKLIDAYQNGNYKFEAKEALLMVENERYLSKIQEALK